MIDTLQGITSHRDDCAQHLAPMRAKLEGLAAELQRPFEPAQRLASLIARQRELDVEREPGKDDLGSEAIVDVPEPIAT